MTTPLISTLNAIVGKQHVLTDDSQTRHYRTGIRFGSGKALAVVRPGSLVEQWRVLKACVAANVIVISQASNTGLTGGSTPDGNDYDRDIVIVSMTRMKTVHLIEDGKQVVCLPGATLDQLERTLAPLGREPHSVIGSSCIGASVFGGICNNSGGALVQRGPAYTELALFARVDAQGRLALTNHLGIRLEGDEETVLAAVERGAFPADAIAADAGAAHDHRYVDHVRQIDAATPARYNADPSRLYEASGSAGKVMVFAVRLDTFPMEKNPVVFYIGSNRIDELTDVRRAALGQFAHLPIAGEYLHRDAFAVAEKYGKDTFLMIQHLGVARLPAMFAFKARCDAFFEKLPFLPANLTDRVAQAISKLFPRHLPQRMMDFHKRYEHHLLLKVSAQGADEARRFLQHYFAGAGGGYFECTPDEGAKAFLHRFAAAGAANRYRAVHTGTVENILALDIALPRNARDWFETLPPEIEAPLMLKLYYGHFLCHVFHQDYIVHKGHDPMAIEHKMWALLDARGAEYPAEHNVGHLYYAKDALRQHYQALDPCNCFNPGIGHTSKRAFYREDTGAPMLKALVYHATDKANLLEGMRAASASAIMLLVGCALHAPDFAWAAIGAFWTSLATAPDSARNRVASMLSFAALSTLAGGLTTCAASAGTAGGAAAIFLFVTSAGLARIWGAKAYQVAILAATACVVMVDRPWHGDAGGMAWLAVYLSGCLFATVLSLILWQVHSPAPEQHSTSWPLAAVQSVRDGLRQLRGHASWSSDGAHFALRLGIATTVAYLTVHMLHLPYGYWATMAVLLILQPSASGTLPRSVERAVGTIVGTVIAIAVSGVATSPLAIALAVFPLIGLTMTLRPAGYGVFVAFLTPSFVLVADYAMPILDEYNYALVRLENNLLGSAIAVAATLILWPLTERLRK